jgi:c-di-GMP-binding flagellar brake protein YcgR
VEANQERRHERRRSAINLVSLEVEGEELVGRTLDLSLGGMRVELVHALPLASPVRVRFALGDRLLDVEAVVRSTVDVAGEMAAVGLELTRVADTTRAELVAYLEARP